MAINPERLGGEAIVTDANQFSSDFVRTIRPYRSVNGGAIYFINEAEYNIVHNLQPTLGGSSFDKFEGENEFGRVQTSQKGVEVAVKALNEAGFTEHENITYVVRRLTWPVKDSKV